MQILLSKSKTLLLPFRSIFQTKPEQKKKILHIKLRLSKAAGHFEDTTSNCFAKSPRKIKNDTLFEK